MMNKQNIFKFMKHIFLKIVIIDNDLNIYTYLGGNTDFTLHINEAGFPTSMLSLLGFTVTVTSGPAEPPGGMVKEVLTFNT